MILDSFGIGRAYDAKLYNDEGSNTYAAISDGIKIPNLIALGLNNIDGVEEDLINHKSLDCDIDRNCLNVDNLSTKNNSNNKNSKDFTSKNLKAKDPLASYGRMVELSAGKDTTTGHFEIVGVISEKPYPTFPNGFDKEIIQALESALCVEFLGNKTASGTEIIKELGDEHYATKKPIIYTSADSVLQLAISEDLYSLEYIYDMCKKAREVMQNSSGKEWGVARIIARPFVKKNGEYIRTENRKDISLKIRSNNLLDKLMKHNIQTVGIGKIYDIFAGFGISKSVTAHGNLEVGTQVINALKTIDNDALIFSNFVDFDMLYGHRNDISGYRKAIEEFDCILPQIIDNMRDDDITIITADHGCDPSTPSTDHSRENVPILIYSKSTKGVNLGTIKGFNFVSDFIIKKFNI